MATQTLSRAQVQVGEGISSAFLLALLLISATGSVISANWTDGLGLITWAALGGLAFGILLAKLPVRGFVAHPFTIVLAMGATAFLPTFLLPAALTWREKFSFLWIRLRDWTIKVIDGGTAGDNLIFVLQLVFVAWLLGGFAAWFVYRRHQEWGAIVMIGSALLFNLFYAAPQSGLYLVLFILGTLLLLVRLNLHAMELRWRSATIGYAADIIFDFFQYGTLFSLLLMLFAWILPDTPPGENWLPLFDVVQPYWTNVEDQFARVFSSVKPVERKTPSTFFGASLVMGGPVNLGRRVVMDVKPGSGQYWRASVFDRYTGQGWINTHVDSLNLTDARLGGGKFEQRTEITQTVKVYLPDANNLLYSASQPVRFDLPIEVRYSKQTSDPNEAGLDIALARSRRPLREGDTYNVVSSITEADEDSLRAVGMRFDYPAAFATDYLQLPEKLPRRVLTLAKTLTENSPTAYDKAAAIERYLRAKIKYSETVSAPPSGRDGVDYLLFDRPEGYCNYYASAMAILARAVGIPARIASGYTLGNFEEGVYHISEGDAHSWPELYFPNYGWIEFEPTASKPEITRTKKSDKPRDADETDEERAERERRRQLNADLEDDPFGNFNPVALPAWDIFFNDPANVAIAGVGFVGLIGLIGSLILITRSRRMNRLAPAAHVYEDMVTLARWLGMQDNSTATPLERARALANRIPDARADTERIAFFYTRERFGAWRARMSDRAALAVAWSRVRAAWWRQLINRIIASLMSVPHITRERIDRFRHPQKYQRPQIRRG